MEFCNLVMRGWNGKTFVYSFVINKVELLVFCNVVTRRFFGFLKDGTRFDSSDAVFKNESWFIKLNKFFK